MVYHIPHYIAGEACTVHSKHKKAIYNPAYGEMIGEVAFADGVICQKAIEAAKKAWPQWANTPPLKRARILFRFRELLERHQLELAKIVTKEHGKTLEDAKGSVARGIEVVEYHCGLLSQLQGKFSLDVANHVDCYTMRQPLGVCAGVSPFNFPVMVPIWMMIPAIGCGNTFILKPSEQDPGAPVRLLELLKDAGLPDGVANCVQGDKTAVDYLLKHPDIQAFTAVASTPVAEYIYKEAICHGKRAHTFGGAKNHCIVMPDADLDYTANAIVGAAFGSAGERCMAISAVVAVGDKTAQQLIAHMKPIIKRMRIDPGESEGADMGPVISASHRERILSAINKGVEEGAELVIDGRDYQHPEHLKGFYLAPSLFDRVQEAMSVYQEEIFGPVLIVMRVDSFQDALNLVNRNQYGNGTAIFTKDGFTARTYVRDVQVGMVGVNVPIPVPIVSHPFGGWKRSSFGDANMHGEESINFYTRRKSVTCRWPSTNIVENIFTMPTH